MDKVELPKDFEPLDNKAKSRVLSEVSWMILTGSYRPANDSDRGKQDG